MALRIATASFPIRSLFKTVSKISFKNGLVRHSSIFVEPSVPWLERPSIVFSTEAVKHHWGAVPVILICAAGLVCEIIALIRLAATRDDVWFTKNSAAYEFIETRRGYKAPIRKLKVYNQKYENPPGLMAAIQGDVDGPPYCPPGDKCNKPKGISAAALAGHAIVGLTAMGAMLVM